MVQLITDRDDVNRIQKRLERALRKGEKFTAWIGHPGGQYKCDVYWFEEHGFWVSLQPETEGNRYWNPFGVQKPRDGAHLNITCEVNFPYEGINRRVAGVLGKDSTGKVYIGHRGRIGGGRESIGKQLFLDNFRGQFIEMVGEPQPVALVAELDNPRLIHHLGLFVQKIARIKQIPSQGAPAAVAAAAIAEYASEFEGIKEYALQNRIAASCDHALVTNRLARALAEADYTVANDRHRDLMVCTSDGKLRAQFEVKSDLAPYSLYTAMGQLLYHAPQPRSDCRLVAVLPKGLTPEPRSRMAHLGIDVLEYELTTDELGVSFFWPGPTAFLNGRG